MNSELRVLIAECRKQNRASQASLFRLFLPYVTSVCKRYLRDESLLQDVVQEVFLSVFKNIKTRYDERKGELKPWIRKIAINTSLNFNKRYQGYEELELRDYSNGGRSATDIDAQISAQEILRLIKTIPATYREVFNLHAIDGYSHQEVAQMLGISIESSRKKLQRARIYIKEHLKRSQKINFTKSA